MQKRVLTLSEDKFLLTITHHKIKNNDKSNNNTINSNTLVDSMTKNIIKPVLRKVTSCGSPSSYFDDDSDKRIDIGSIERIQRGQSTFKFELARYVILYFTTIYIYLYNFAPLNDIMYLL